MLGPSGSGKSTLALSLNGLIPHALPAEVTGTITVAGHAGIRDARRRAQHPRRDGLPGSRRPAVHRIRPRRGRLRPGEPADAGGRGARARPRRRSAASGCGTGARRTPTASRAAAASASRSPARSRWARPCSCSTSRPRTSTRWASRRSTPPWRDVVARGDRAIVLIEHNLDAAIGLVDRVVVLDRAGRLAFDGPAHEVLRDNADALVAHGRVAAHRDARRPAAAGCRASARAAAPHARRAASRPGGGPAPGGRAPGSGDVLRIRRFRGIRPGPAHVA